MKKSRTEGLTQWVFDYFTRIKASTPRRPLLAQREGEMKLRQSSYDRNNRHMRSVRETILRCQRVNLVAEVTLKRELALLLTNPLIAQIEIRDLTLLVTTRSVLCKKLERGVEIGVCVLGPLVIEIPIGGAGYKLIEINPTADSFVRAYLPKFPVLPHNHPDYGVSEAWQRCWGGYGTPISVSYANWRYGDLVSLILRSLQVAENEDGLGQYVDDWPELGTLPLDELALVERDQLHPGRSLLEAEQLADELTQGLILRAREIEATHRRLLAEAMAERDSLARQIILLFNEDLAQSGQSATAQSLERACREGLAEVAKYSGWDGITVDDDWIQFLLPEYQVSLSSTGPLHRIPPFYLRISFRDRDPFLQIRRVREDRNTPFPPGVTDNGELLVGMEHTTFESLGSLRFNRFLGLFLTHLENPDELVSNEAFSPFPLVL